MHLVPFLIYSTIGSALWIFGLTYAGYLLGDNYDLVDEYLGPVSKIVLATLIIGFAIWVGRRMMRRKT
jgi:membrane protein DedA with SNARE-associated domain